MGCQNGACDRASSRAVQASGSPLKKHSESATTRLRSTCAPYQKRIRHAMIKKSHVVSLGGGVIAHPVNDHGCTWERLMQRV